VTGPRATAIVLAAGGATRFGGGKLVAELDGRPLLQWVLDALDAARLDDVVVVLGEGADEVEAAVAWRAERRVRNLDPAAGLSSSLRVGLAAVPSTTDVVLVALGDQPLVRPEVATTLVGRAASGPRPIAVPRYTDDGGTNPVALRRAAFDLATGVAGDRGLGPLLRARPELVEEVPVEGANPDVDTLEDLERLRAREDRQAPPGPAALPAAEAGSSASLETPERAVR
jgi:molybdenum cofactor cytidylyltransferase